MALVEHARMELERAGIFNKDADYDGMLGGAVMELVEKFAAQGHSGFSAMRTLQLFNRVASFKTLLPVTSDPAEWINISKLGGKNSLPVWQNKRDSSYFSCDGGKHFYSVDEKPIWKLRWKRRWFEFIAKWA